MISSVQSNLSALRAFGEKTAVTANNVANVESEGFKKSRALLKEGAGGNVEVDILGIETPGEGKIEVTEDEIKERERSNVDLAEELTETILTRSGYEANAAVVRTRDETLGTLLDILS